MTVVPFDTLARAGKLEAGGFSHDQARVSASALADALTERVATTDDITLLRHDFDAFRVELHRDMDGFRTEIRQDMEAFRVELHRDMDGFRTEIRHEMAAFKTDIGRDLENIRKEMRIQSREIIQLMTIRLGGLIVVATGILLAANFFS